MADVTPECLRIVTVDDVYAAAAGAAAGGGPRMKTLVLWGDGGVEAARARHEDGAALLLWDGERSTALDAAGIPYRSAASLTAGAQDEIDEAAMAWTKEWGRRPLLDGRSFRELFAWKGVSLWWFAELYLHHSTDAPRHVRVIESVHRILDAEAPDELETVGLSPEDTLLVERTCTARGVLFHGPRRLTRFPAAAQGRGRGAEQPLERGQGAR